MHSSTMLYRSAVIAALGGFLFGFDTVVISGAEQTIQSLWELSSTQHGWAMSSALWGMVAGSFIGGWPTDRVGRKKTLQLIGALFFVSAVWSALAGDVYSFSIARLIGGLGVGISTVASPLYISEISPPRLRGRLAGMFQFNIVFGILIAFLSNYLIGKWVDEHAWRWMLGVEAAPALIYTICCLVIPESPRWLIAKRGDRSAAVEILTQVNPDSDDAEVAALADEIAQSHETTEAASKGGFFSARLRTPILLAFLIAFFNQLSGINAILYFAPRIFGLTGLKEEDALLQSVSLGLTNLIFTFVGLYLIDRLGRRTLLLIGSIGYIASLGVIGMTFINTAPAFSVATAALDVRGNVSKLDSAIDKNLAEEEVETIRATLDDAREGLTSASRAEEYRGEAVEISDSVSPDEMKGRAPKRRYRKPPSRPGSPASWF